MIRAALVVVLIALTIAGGGAIVIATTDGDEQRSSRAEATRDPASVSPSATPAPTRAPTQAAATTAPTALPDRTNCAEIKGTPYRSDTERAFYLTSCSAPAPTNASAPAVSQDASAACGTDVQVTTGRSDKTFNVSGTTVDQINASLEANGPIVDGEKAVGLTEYRYGIDGSFCTRPGSCTLGAITISADIVVTLPNLTTLAQLTPDIKALWDRFAELVRVHENRHVIIVEEGLAEIKRQLLLLDQQPNCDSLDHEVDKVWVLYTSQMEQRQNAFHAADRAGQGGSVVR